jgi:hypothetical protein
VEIGKTSVAMRGQYKTHNIADATVSDIVYRIMASTSNEEALSGEKKNSAMEYAYTNTGSSISELAYPLD